ncbi:MAG: signal peptide peptidase SppA [Salinivirgaceae bacterium]|nr:MAG: signal peptide peptidase SppA [Salinivirgaceae bacterium]
MKSFFKYFFASFLAAIIAFVIGILILIGIVGSMLNQEKVVVVNPNSVLQITLDNAVMDRAPNNPLENFDPVGMSSETGTSLKKILDNIKKASADDNIKGIFLYLDNVNAGMATVSEIRSQLQAFKDSNKFVIAYGNYYSQKAYYLATVADKVYVNPEGGAGMTGLASQVMFFKKTLAKVGIEPQVIRHGKYKSAVEPFLDNKMSEANREQISAYLGSLWNVMLEKVAESRGLTVEDLQTMADEMSIVNVDDAVEANLVDGARYFDQVIDEMKAKVEIADDKDLELVKFKDYFHTPSLNADKLVSSMDKIAVVYAQGEIGSGKGNTTEMGTENVANAIRKARKDDKIKAIVLRVNSPGGSALTSEVILREVELTKGVKPIVASMGDVAASGGYYISCLADTIVASPNTITGSIGVFGLLFQAQELIQQKIGINVEVVKTAKHADMGSMFRPLSIKERDVIKGSIEEIYTTFITHVAKGRGMTIEAVDEVGQGRVWSGADAIGIGLVDVLGGLNDAIAIAAKMAGSEDYVVKEYPKQKDPFQQIMENFGASASLEGILVNNHQLSPYFKHLRSLSNMKDIQMRLPYDIIIE